MDSALEKMFFKQIVDSSLPAPICQFQFHPLRKWRFDFCYPNIKLAIEVEGGVWANGRHVRPLGFEADCIKYNTAACFGWTVLRVTAKMIKNKQALKFIKEFFTSKESAEDFSLLQNGGLVVKKLIKKSGNKSGNKSGDGLERN